MIRKDVRTSLLKYQSFKTGNTKPTDANEAASLQDGVVDFREYVMAISMLIDGSAVEKLRWSFRLYDKDSDGAITREEMLEIMQVCVCVRSQTFPTTATEATDDASFSPTVFPFVHRPFIR